MSFIVESVIEINNTAPDGTILGSSPSQVKITYAVRSLYVTENGCYAELHYSYDESKWQLFKSYDVTLSTTSGTPLLEQAEAQIKALAEFTS